MSECVCVCVCVCVCAHVHIYIGYCMTFLCVLFIA